MVSDSPGILKAARALGIQVGSAVTLQGRTHSAFALATTKGVPVSNSSESVVESSITDLNWLMHARVVYSGGSSFTRGAELGSLCADFRALRLVCPNYAYVFPRRFHRCFRLVGTREVRCSLRGHHLSLLQSQCRVVPEQPVQAVAASSQMKHLGADNNSRKRTATSLAAVMLMAALRHARGCSAADTDRSRVTLYCCGGATGYLVCPALPAVARVPRGLARSAVAVGTSTCRDGRAVTLYDTT